MNETQETVPQDDRVITRAFYGSLAVLVGIGVLVGLGFLLKGGEAPSKPVVETPVAPQVQEKTSTVPEVRFLDVTAKAGIDFVHENGARGRKLLPETMGGGCAFLDFDGDDDADLLLVNSATWPGEKAPDRPPTLTLYENHEGSFKDVTEARGLAVTLYGMGVACGDYDRDGDVDVFISAVGTNKLFRNDGARFEDVTATAGVAGDASEWSTSAAFFDMERDGDLDLFVCNYVRWSRKIDLEVNYQLTGLGRAYGPPTHFKGSYCYLYRNEGDGTFTDVSASSGVQINNPATDQPMGKALGVAPADCDADGWIDLLVANDTVQNFLLLNQQDGTFYESGVESGVAYDRNGLATGAMGIDSAHYRNDSSLGFGIGNFANEMTSLYASEEGFFMDEAITDGIGPTTRLMLTFGLFFFDYDLDGRLDLFQANGHLEDEINKVQPSQHYRQPAQLFWNAGTGGPHTFVPIDGQAVGDLAKPLVGRGAAYNDFDGDGDLDILITQTGGAPALLRNNQDLGHHWLRVRLRAKKNNTEGIGAWVSIDIDGKVQKRQVMPTCSYLSQILPEAYFGLGAAEKVDALSVTWPDASVQKVDNVPIDQVLVVEEKL